jgi:hypothetical protein
MFPGLTTRISSELIALATTIAPRADVVHITDTTTTTVVATITPQFGGQSGMMIVVNRSGNNITTVTTGNIATAVTIGQNVATLLVFSKLTGKYYPGALA